MTLRTNILTRLKKARNLSAADRLRLTMLANEVGSIKDRRDDRHVD